MANVQLVVLDTNSLTVGDTTLQSLLETFGHTVTLVADATSPNVTGVDLVVIGASQTSSSAAQDYSGQDVPILCFGRRYWPKLGWSTSTGAAFGSWVQELRPYGTTHPTHAGFDTPGAVDGDSSYDVTVLTQDVGTWRRPDGEPVALDVRWRLHISSSPVIFTFDAAASLLDSKTALQRQAAWGFSSDADVQYLSAAGESVVSALVDWTLGETATLNIPTGFAFTAGSGSRQLDGSWNAVSGADGYEWEVQRDASGSWEPFTSGSGAGTSFQLTDTDGVDWGETYRARVRATAS